MRFQLAAVLLILPLTAALAQTAPTPEPPAVAKPAALTADGIPAVPAALAARTRPYMEFRTAGFSGWNPRDRSMLITTRFADTAQIHRVAMPMGAREQLSFEAEPVRGSWSPAGDVIAVQKDVGGNEFFQLYTLVNGRMTLVTDGRSRNEFGAWSHDGRLVGYSSTRRNGTDSDLYIVDPRNPSTDRRVAEVSGGGWGIVDFSPDGARAVVIEYRQITKSNLHLLDVQRGGMTPIGDHSREIAYGGAQFAPDGSLWVTSDEGSDFQRLGRLDVTTGRFTPVVTDLNWDVENFDISADGRFIAYVTNEAGISRLRLLDPATGRSRLVTALPAGVIGGLEVAPWGRTIGLSFASARSASDAYSVDPTTLAVTRWTRSETGGLDAEANVEPELVEVRSFDREPISGFLYRPDPARFPGRRPLIVNIHGGPEAQTRPGFQGRNNYLINELGIAIFYPNVRGSTGYGKRFVGLDNGPALRENSVRDIGAFLDRLSRDPALDPARIAVTGGSYGGYMCYASAIRFGDRLRAANCVVAISNFVTFLENTQSYRRDLRRVEYGDERTQRADLLRISPMTRVSELRIPLMVVTGANDPRVPQSEADQMVAAVRGSGRPAWHLIGQNEGHGFARKENQDYNFWVNLMFWQQHLLGDTAAPPAR
jgi:dipeptidyl aminopeptidase/acylaminoacyl peptidase